MFKKLGLAIGTGAITMNASAYDWSTVTGGIDLSGEATAVAAVVGVLATVYVVRKGARLVLGMLK